MSQPANRHAAMAVASVMAFALALAAGCALLWASPDRASLLVEQGGTRSMLAGTPAWAFKPTKFGPLRRQKWTASRYRVLALWEAAERSTESCMDAVDEIYPDARDDSCVDIDRAMTMVQECMRNQRDGYQGLADSKNGAWDALPELVDMTHALSNADREMVATKLDKSAVFYTLARLEALHAGCHGLRPAKQHQHRTGQLTNPNGLADAVNRVDHAIQYMRKVGGVYREEMPRGPAGGWTEGAKAHYAEPDNGKLSFKGNNDALRRAARRGYLPDPFDPRSRPAWGKRPSSGGSRPGTPHSQLSRFWEKIPVDSIFQVVGVIGVESGDARFQNPPPLHLTRPTVVPCSSPPTRRLESSPVPGSIWSQEQGGNVNGPRPGGRQAEPQGTSIHVVIAGAHSHELSSSLPVLPVALSK